MNMLKYAYIGDAVYELFVRDFLINYINVKMDDIHKKATSIVCAHMQSKIIAILQEKNIISEQEIDIYKKGRNTKTSSKSKNANIQEYHRATGFETLIGYLYLNDKNRLEEILAEVLTIIKQEIKYGE